MVDKVVVVSDDIVLVDEDIVDIVIEVELLDAVDLVELGRVALLVGSVVLVETVMRVVQLPVVLVHGVVCEPVFEKLLLVVDEENDVEMNVAVTFEELVIDVEIDVVPLVIDIEIDVVVPLEEIVKLEVNDVDKVVLVDVSKVLQYAHAACKCGSSLQACFLI